MSHWLLNQQELAIVRRAYARQMVATANVRNDRLEQAFATVRREDFLGDEPWRIARGPALPVNDPVYVNEAWVLGLVHEGGVNKASPSCNEKMLNDLEVERGEHIAHIGAGGGYYTAILGELTGRAGRVTAIEFAPRLAERAR